MDRGYAVVVTARATHIPDENAHAVHDVPSRADIRLMLNGDPVLLDTATCMNFNGEKDTAIFVLDQDKVQHMGINIPISHINHASMIMDGKASALDVMPSVYGPALIYMSNGTDDGDAYIKEVREVLTHADA